MKKGYEKVSFDDLSSLEKINGFIKFKGESKESRYRFKREDKDTLFIYASGRRSYGYRIYRFNGQVIFNGKEIEYFLIPIKKKPAEVYIEKVLKYRNYFNKYCHPNLWENLRKELNEFTEENINNFLKDNTITSEYEAWKKSGLYNIPKIEDYKTLTLKTCGFKDEIISKIKECIEKKEEFDFYHEGNYDYSVRGRLCEDGIYRAWLSAEYRGMGNGHYYILISENNALFGEDD